jgi:hypothetical protein
MIRKISGALHMRKDERMLAEGASFEAFREFCVRSYDDAPLGDETTPESAKTIISGIADARSALRDNGAGRYSWLDGPALQVLPVSRPLHGGREGP